jgi:putative transcriptional regulator
MQSLQGHLLVASRSLRDPNFVGTVVLMIRHDENGALGVVLNRPADKTLRELWESVSQTPCASDERINLGGPVPGPLMAIHTQESLADAEILPGIYFAAEKDKLESLVARADERLRIFVGHAGWGGGQLEGELEQGAWLTAPATADYIFYGDTDLWEQVTKSIGRSVLQSMLKIKEVPDDPSVN